MFSPTGSPESPLCCSGAALSRHLPDCRLEPSSCESSPGDKGKLHCLHSYRQGRMLLLLRSHRLSLSLPPHFTTPKKSILFFKKASSTRCYVVWYLLCRCALCGGRCDGLCNNTYTTRWDRHLSVAGGKSSCPSDAFPFIPTGQHALSLSVDLKTMDEKTGFGLALDPLLLNSCSVGNRMTT